MDTPITAAHHAHDAGLGASQDLVNTLELDGRDGLPEDHLTSAAVAVDFLAGRGLAHEPDLRAQLRRDGDDAWLVRIREARAALRELWDAQVEGRAPDRRALATLNGILDRGPHLELRPTLAGVEVAHRHPEDDPTGEALARIALPLVDAIARGETGRFRICANERCRWVFEDESRAGRRRWCDMTTCGNRAKVRRYRSRRKSGESAPEADEGHGHAPAPAAG